MASEYANSGALPGLEGALQGAADASVPQIGSNNVGSGNLFTDITGASNAISALVDNVRTAQETAARNAIIFLLVGFVVVYYLLEK